MFPPYLLTRVIFDVVVIFEKKCQFHFLNRYFPPTLAAHLLIPTKFVAAISISLTENTHTSLVQLERNSCY